MPMMSGWKHLTTKVNGWMCGWAIVWIDTWMVVWMDG